MVNAVFYDGCSVFAPRLLVIESGSFFFRFDYLINIGLFIGNEFFGPYRIGTVSYTHLTLPTKA